MLLGLFFKKLIIIIIKYPINLQTLEKYPKKNDT